MSGVYTGAGRRDAAAGGAAVEHDRARRRAPSCPPPRARSARRHAIQRSAADDARLDALLLSSLARPATTVCAPRSAAPRRWSARACCRRPDAQHGHGETDGCAWMRVAGRRVRSSRQRRTIPRPATHDAGADRVARPRRRLRRRARRARRRTHSASSGPMKRSELGFDGLLAEHRRAWASRWEDADVRSTGIPSSSSRSASRCFT